MAYGIITQKWCGMRKPIAYLSKLLDPVVRGWPTFVGSSSNRGVNGETDTRWENNSIYAT